MHLWGQWVLKVYYMVLTLWNNLCQIFPGIIPDSSVLAGIPLGQVSVACDAPHLSDLINMPICGCPS